VNAQINGINIAFSDEGQGQPIVFLHAFPLNRSMWDPQVEGLKSQFRIITIDLRGHGESEAPMWRYSLGQFAEDIKGLLEHLGISKAAFVGLSMGGYILFTLYRKYPSLFNALVLADTRATADTPEAKATRFSMAQIAYKRGSSTIAELMLPKLLGSTSLDHRQDLVEQLRHMITANEISGIVGDLMAMEERPDSTLLLRDLKIPTLVIVGEEDVASPPEEVQGMAEHIPGAKFTIIPEAGHVSNLDQPKLFNQSIREFLGK
jgi:3-oxoadipate enol-lactonase